MVTAYFNGKVNFRQPLTELLAPFVFNATFTFGLDPSVPIALAKRYRGIYGNLAHFFLWNRSLEDEEMLKFTANMGSNVNKSGMV